MVNRQLYYRKKQSGMGREADVLGAPHAVYRLTDQSNGDFVSDANRIVQNHNVLHKMGVSTTFKRALETELRKGVLWYELISDMRQFKVGDVFVNTDTVFGDGFITFSGETNEFNGFCFAGKDGLRMMLGARLNTWAIIGRGLNQQPAAGSSGSAHWSDSASGGYPLTIQNGQAVLGSDPMNSPPTFSVRPGTGTPQPAIIPIGLQARENTTGGKSFTGVPDPLKDPTFVAYVPPLPGFDFIEGDFIWTIDGAQYRVMVPFGQKTGVVGSQLELQREASPSC